MAKDITLKNADGSVIYYPKTVSDLVYNNETGKTVKEELGEVDNKILTKIASLKSSMVVYCDYTSSTISGVVITDGQGYIALTETGSVSIDSNNNALKIG